MPSPPTSRILLTGASGYIGLHILRELVEAGHEVRAVVRCPEKLGPYAEHPLVSVLLADLETATDLVAALTGLQACVHAALIWGEPGSEYEARDVALTARLFEAAGRVGVKRGVYLSSSAVHRPFAGEMTEGDLLCPPDIYGATKAAGEMLFRAACAQGGVVGVILRPGPVVGAPAFPGGAFRTPNPISEMVCAASEGRAIEVVRGQGRQFSDVTMVARAVRRLVSGEVPHCTYICADRAIVTWEWIARAVLACSGSSSTLRILPGEERETAPRFLTERIEALLGGPTDAEGALLAHILELMNGGDSRDDQAAPGPGKAFSIPLPRSRSCLGRDWR